MNRKLYIGTELADFDERFNVMFSIGDVRNVGFGNSNKSYPLTLPLTKTNKRLVAFINRPDVKTEIDKTGRLYLGDLLIIQGQIIITDVQDSYIKLIINSDDWIDTLKERKLTALDLSAFDHALTHANVEGSWTAAYPFYRYPMINFGALMSGETGATANFYPNDFIPMFSITQIITEILKPYTISSAWLANATIKDYFILARETLLPDSFITKKALEVTCTADADNENSRSVGAGATVVAICNKNPLVLTTEVTDEGADWSIVSSQYTVPETGTYRFQGRFKLHCTDDAGLTVNQQVVTLRIIQNAATIVSYTDTQASNIINGLDKTLDTYYIHCTAGDTINMTIALRNDVTNTTGSPITTIMGADATDTWIKAVWTNGNKYPGLNKNISAEEMLPDITQLDFISAVRDIFNLRFWMDKSRQVIYIEPWDQLLSSTVKDITQYVNFESDPPQELIAKNYNKTILFKWKDDSFSDKAYEKYLKTNVSPGRKEVTLTSIYANPEPGTREHPWSNIIMGYCWHIAGGAGVSMPRIWEEVIDSDTPLVFNRKANFNTRIVEWKGNTAGGTWYYNTEAKTSYPKILGLDWTTIYSTYWLKFLHYVDKGKLFTFTMKLKPGFLTEFLTVVNTSTSEGFRPVYKITINGSDLYFFLQKITSDGESAELELVLKQ